jgi:predicted metal-binding protein
MNPIIISINPLILQEYFDEHVRELCMDCKRYRIKASCPPNLPSIRYYKDAFIQYKHGVLILKKFEIDNIENWKELGKNSSRDLEIEIHKIVDELKYENYDNYDYYGAGSCKNCEICSFPCRFPNKQLPPLEGTGINVIRLVQDVAHITLKFPVESYGYFYRVGLVLWN